ncbi:MAG: RagB/SusD family nutrient uptake outer membrane protein [Ginsengibacter sp.]
MKNKIYLTGFFFIIITAATSCKKNYLDREPLDQISSAVFFKRTSDLELYMNGFYLPELNLLDFGQNYTGNTYSQLVFLNDMNSDNSIDQSVDERLNGTRVVPSAGGGWNYENVRRINYFFENYQKCQDDFESYKQYVGEAYFFRAMIYYQLVQQFGDVQWYDKVLSTNSEELFNARTSRNIVIDHIIADLDSAAIYLDEESRDGGNRLDRWSALTVQSRVALYEGTWEKYHNGTAFGVANPDPEKYLNKAAEAALKIINSGRFAIYTTGNPNEDYYNLFDIHDYSGNKEVILWKKFDRALGIVNYRMVLGTWPRGYGITKSLADSYLCTDGLPVAVSPLFQGYTTLNKESQNRDPRFKQTIFTPDAPFASTGVVYTNWDEGMFSTRLFTAADYNAPTGYVIRKGTTYNLSEQNYAGEDEPVILFDYAEVLLNYAEAKAELGTISQADIDLSIKPIRDRVGMPDLLLTSIVTDPKWEFPTLSPVINEIRRERRVELALVGFRWNDIARWAGADELIAGKRPKGSQFGSTFALDPYPDDADGFMDPFAIQIPIGYGFNLNRDYLNPLPQSELTLNEKLTQNPGW